MEPPRLPKKLHPRAVLVVVFSVMTIPFAVSAMSFDNLTFNFPNFEMNTGDIDLLGNASLMNQCIYLTSATLDQGAISNIGWATYHAPMHLWDKDTGNVADFTARFSFIIDSQNKNFTQFADGLAFFMAPESSGILACSVGLYLGLTCNWTEASGFNRTTFIAVEFDTFYNTNLDSLNDTHVGIDVNSVVSLKSIPWDWNRIKTGGLVQATIAYDWGTQNLSVVWSDGSGLGGNSFSSLWYGVNLTAILPEKVIIGFSTATGYASELHKICSWEFSSSLLIAPNKVKPRKMRAIIYVALGAAGVFALLCVLSCYICNRICRGSGSNKSIRKALKLEEDRPKEYTYHVLKMATDDFAKNHVLGVGGFGKVYRGVLDGDSVAIKKFSPESTQGVDEYIAELKALGGQLKHQNLVKLEGFCHERTELLLVYELVENGSLSSYLSGGRGLLDWGTRYRIAQDLAAALFFLHEKCTQCVLHQDIKCDNVMLDSSFTAKLGDFGLARLVDHGRQSHMTVPAGTHGYIAPEYASTGKASKESDVCSFGIVLLEIASGRRVGEVIDGHEGLVDWVWQLYGARRLLEAADSNLAGDFDETQMRSVMIVGLWCAHPRDSERPLIHEAMQVLNGRASLPNLPRTRPMLGQPPLPFNIASSSHSFHSSSGTAFMTAPSGFEIVHGIGSDFSVSSSTPLISSTQ